MKLQACNTKSYVHWKTWLIPEIGVELYLLSTNEISKNLLKVDC